MKNSADTPHHDLDSLLQVMERLRDPQTGCDWDLRQSYRSIAPSTIEEAYEVVDAIEREDYEHLREELGDLLFQVVFYSRLAAEEGRFSFADVVHQLSAKLIRRHPHVFPQGTLESRRDPATATDQGAIVQAWEALKQQERQAKGNAGVLDDVPVALPALTRALKLQKRASSVGFDWDNSAAVVSQLEEETVELKAAMAAGDSAAIAEEAGDLLFAAVNLVRHLKLDPEATLRQSNAKFERRFRFIEAALQETQRSAAEASVDEMEQLWQKAKRAGL